MHLKVKKPEGKSLVCFASLDLHIKLMRASAEYGVPMRDLIVAGVEDFLRHRLGPDDVMRLRYRAMERRFGKEGLQAYLDWYAGRGEADTGPKAPVQESGPPAP